MSTDALLTTPAATLSPDRFRAAIDKLPLVSIDLLVRDPQGRYLLGLRTNPPASEKWFVPGGRIRKNERLHQALGRLANEELGMTIAPKHWYFNGVYEHFYDINFAGETGMSTHYVVLAYQLSLALDRTASPSDLSLSFPSAQHRDYRWSHPTEVMADTNVHPYTKSYFTEQHP
jgi:colanic acid biosynthesis protein WcaH